jgi:hypothetical protein
VPLPVSSRIVRSTVSDPLRSAFAAALVIGYVGLWQVVGGREASPNNPALKLTFFVGFVVVVVLAGMLIIRMPY